MGLIYISTTSKYKTTADEREKEECFSSQNLKKKCRADHDDINREEIPNDKLSWKEG